MAEMMSGGTGADVVEIHVSGSRVEEECAEQAVQRIPAELWGLICTFLATKAANRLSKTCSWLKMAVTSSLESLTFYRELDGFSAPSFTSLRAVSIYHAVNHTDALHVLLACPQLKELNFSLSFKPIGDEAAALLPRFPRLQWVNIFGAVLNAQLGQALAGCEALQVVIVSMGNGRGGRAVAADSVVDFLRELVHCSGLRELIGVSMRCQEDCTQLCASVGAWKQLRRLWVHVDPDRSARWRMPELAGLATAVSAACPLIEWLNLSQVDGSLALSAEDGTAIAKMDALIHLSIHARLPIPGSLFATPSTSSLVHLDLNCPLEGVGYELLPAFLRRHPLRRLLIFDSAMPASTVTAIFLVIAEHSELEDVTLHGKDDSWSDAERQAAGAALGTAVRNSCVRDWSVDAVVSLLAVLRAWDAQQPAAQLRRLHLDACDSASMAEDSASSVALLLDCLHSCPSLLEVDLRVEAMGDAAIEVAEELLEEPLERADLTLIAGRSIASHFDGRMKDLLACGVSVW
eukprot:PLAT2489.2.p1 GENE.PLAT2489.2~~PLAT2489.2.p1  ORF type:complete len:518 (+),score=97.17 PLAT2489.2:332-1885(+)